MGEAGGQERVFRAIDLRTVVVNLTLRCNQACAHCQVSSSPARREEASAEVLDRVLGIAADVRPDVVDLTGGAPEYHPLLRDFVRRLRSDGHRVQLRTNLTVLLEPEMADLPAFLSAEKVDLLASLPCYTDRNVRLVRGEGVRDASIEVMRRLNALGYGTDGGLRLDLVYNPVGTMLPEPQASLEALFRDELAERFGVSFTHLLTMTNMPVGRFREHLTAEGTYPAYIAALREAFNPATLPHLMCRHQIEVGCDGRLYDCDFDFGEGVPVSAEGARSVWDFDAERVTQRRIDLKAHCWGCTAGAGSS
jgi:radical SAM/Cys-rich protein